MRLFRHLDELPDNFGPVIGSVGNFDGLHRAHQKVISEVVRRARQAGATSIVVTFDPHPTRVLRPDVAPRLLTPLPVKLRLLQDSGLDAVLVLPFTRDLSLMPPREFVRQILVDALRARELHEGFNFHFGHRAEGNVKRLADLGREFGFDVQAYPAMTLRGEVVSSSRLRQLIVEGDVSRARCLLGRVFSISSTPGRGRGYGHKYTVPTINLSRYDELIPRNGVYITRTRIAGENFDSVTNVGVRPTFGQDSFAIESHLLNFHPISLTAQTEVELCFLRRIRDEMKFPSVDALREQIARDVHRARRYFHHLGRNLSTKDAKEHKEA